jgi:hypothetical protein
MKYTNKIAIVRTTWKGAHTATVRCVAAPLPVVAPPVGPGARSTPVCLAVAPLPVVPLPAGPCAFAAAMHLIFKEIPLVVLPSYPGIGAAAMHQVSRNPLHTVLHRTKCARRALTSCLPQTHLRTVLH